MGVPFQSGEAVDTTARSQPGRYEYLDDRTLVYVQGVTGSAAGSFVTFTPAGVTTLLVPDAVGTVGVLLSAIDATQYGYAQVFGRMATAYVNSAALGVALVDAGLAGRVTATGGGDRVDNCFILATAAGVGPVFLNYPSVSNVAALLMARSSGADDDEEEDDDDNAPPRRAKKNAKNGKRT